MAELAGLLAVDFRNPASLEGWALNHADDHTAIRDAIQREGGGNIVVRELYPVNLRDWQAFALRHQDAHNDMNAALGLPGVDFTSLKFDDPKDVNYWNFNHFREHQAARQKLGI